MKTQNTVSETTKFNITLPLTVTYEPGREKNFMHLKFADMCANLNDDNGKEIGSVSGCIGMGVEFMLNEDGRVFYVNVQTLWNAFIAMLGKYEFKVSVD